MAVCVAWWSFTAGTRSWLWMILCGKVSRTALNCAQVANWCAQPYPRVRALLPLLQGFCHSSSPAAPPVDASGHAILPAYRIHTWWWVGFVRVTLSASALSCFSLPCLSGAVVLHMRLCTQSVCKQNRFWSVNRTERSQAELLLKSE